MITLPTKWIKSPVGLSPSVSGRGDAPFSFGSFSRSSPLRVYQRASRAQAGVPSSSHGTDASCSRGSDPPEKGVS
jgi:hypothetical protein